MRTTLIYFCIAVAVIGYFADKNGQFAEAIERGYFYRDFNASAYCPCERCCGRWSRDGVNTKGERVTASGHVIQPRDCFVAAPRSYPFGAVLEIPGYNDGRAVRVEDRGGAIREGARKMPDKLDLFYESHQDALNYGRKKVRVKVYTVRGSYVSKK